MKLSKILLLLILMGAVMSCSKDDDPDPNVEDAALSFSNDQAILQVPEGLLQSTDENAQMAAMWVALANSMSANISLFTPPTGATKTTDFITPLNGRTEDTKGVVYYWSHQEFGSVAYQIKDAESKYTFEFFFKGASDPGWYRYMYAEESKDRSQGYMAIYDAWGAVDDSKSAELLRWSWTRKGDMFSFKMVDGPGAFNFTVEINTKTKAGSVVYFEDNKKQSEMEWDAAGKGSWKRFDSSGAVVEEGTW